MGERSTANHPLQRQRGIFTGIRPCSAFDKTRRICCITNLRPNETVTANRYQQQLFQLNDELMQKGSSIANDRCKVILLIICHFVIETCSRMYKNIKMYQIVKYIYIYIYKCI